jgi:hypothetical protein
VDFLILVSEESGGARDQHSTEFIAAFAGEFYQA